MTSSDPALNVMLRQVREVLPYASSRAVLCDLGKDGDNINNYIDGCIYYLNLSKSIQSAAGLKALKSAANGRYLMCKPLPYCCHLLYRSTFILLSLKCMLGLFVIL